MAQCLISLYVLEISAEHASISFKNSFHNNLFHFHRKILVPIQTVLAHDI